jgi:hypothetical protein
MKVLAEKSRNLFTERIRLIIRTNLSLAIGRVTVVGRIVDSNFSSRILCPPGINPARAVADRTG